MKRRSFFALLTGSVAALFAGFMRKEVPTTDFEWSEPPYPPRFIMHGGNYVKLNPWERFESDRGGGYRLNPQWVNAPYEMKQNVTFWKTGAKEIQYSIEKRA